MRLNSFSLSLLSESALVSRVAEMEEPAILLGDDLKIIAKNKRASALFFDLRRGRGISKFLAEGAESKIVQMQPQEVVYTELISGVTHYGAAVIRAEGCFLIIIRPASSDLRTSLEAIYSKSSGYDIELPEPDIESPNPKMQKLIKRTMHALGTARGLRFFNVSDVVKSIIREISAYSNGYASGINVSVIDRELISVGSEYDFAMIVAYIISFFIGASDNRNINIEVFGNQNEISVNMSAVTHFAPYEIARIVSGRFDCNMETDLGSDEYWFRLIKLLTDGNLWDFDINGGENGELSFTLRLPHAEKREGFALHDISPEYIREIIEVVFSNM